MFSRLPRRLGVIVLTGLLTLIAASATAASLPSGSYAGPWPMASGAQPGRLILDQIDVTAQQVTVRLRLVNDLTQNLKMSCAAAGADQRIRILLPSGQQVPPTQSYCTARSGMSVTVKPGAALPMTATFANKQWADGTFGLYWYGYAAGAMQLRAGEIVAVAPPPGSSIGDLRSSWTRFSERLDGVGALLLIALVLIVGLWFSVWFVRSGRSEELARQPERPARAPAARRAPPARSRPEPVESPRSRAAARRAPVTGSTPVSR